MDSSQGLSLNLRAGEPHLASLPPREAPQTQGDPSWLPHSLAYSSTPHPVVLAAILGVAYSVAETKSPEAPSAPLLHTHTHTHTQRSTFSHVSSSSPFV